MAEDYRPVLEAVREALAIPSPATIGDEPAQREILHKRAMHALIALDAVLGERRGDVAWQAAYLREQLAKHPATGYRTWHEAVAGRRAAEAAAARPSAGEAPVERD